MENLLSKLDFNQEKVFNVCPKTLSLLENHQKTMYRIKKDVLLSELEQSNKILLKMKKSKESVLFIENIKMYIKDLQDLLNDVDKFGYIELTD